MKIRYTALVAFTTMLFYTVTYAEDISGVIAVDTLKVENSPYNVVGNLFLPFWQTLVIEPGVTLKFNSGLNFIIDGPFKAEGTSSDSIKFTSNNGLPASGDWIGILIRASQPMLTAFSTASSSATLPITLDAVEHKIGVSNKTSITLWTSRGSDCRDPKWCF